MKALAPRLEPDAPLEPRRGEPRTQAVRIAEYTRFPRVADAIWRRATTRDLSESGLGLVVERPERVGTLLRVVVRDVFGSVAREAVLRVVWCRPEPGGRHRIGMERLAESARRMAVVRRDTDGRRLRV